MQPFFIKSFKNLNGPYGNNTIWEYQTVGECYRSGQHTRKLYDFLCDGTTTISSVQRNENQPIAGQALPTGTVFSIGSILRNGAHQKKITKIKIVNGNVMFECISVHTQEPVVDTPMLNAQLFVEPAVEVGAANNEALNRLQTRILQDNPRALRVEGLLRVRGNQTLKEFVQCFFQEFNNSAVESNSTRNTIFVDDPDRIQTVRGKRRSLGDLFVIFRYYYPTCTLKDVAKLLYITLPPLMPHLASCKCREINKRVWFFDEARTNEYKHTDEADEYGYTKRQYSTMLA